MKTSVSRLFAVTLFTPYRMVRSSLPCQRRGEGRGEWVGERRGGEGRGGEGRGVGLCFHESLY